MQASDFPYFADKVNFFWEWGWGAVVGLGGVLFFVWVVWKVVKGIKKIYSNMAMDDLWAPPNNESYSQSRDRCDVCKEWFLVGQLSRDGNARYCFPCKNKRGGGGTGGGGGGFFRGLFEKKESKEKEVMFPGIEDL